MVVVASRSRAAGLQPEPGERNLQKSFFLVKKRRPKAQIQVNKRIDFENVTQDPPTSKSHQNPVK